MVLLNKILYDHYLSALNAYLVFLQRNDYRQKNDFPNHLLLRPFSVWRQLSCPVRVNYPVRFLVKN